MADAPKTFPRPLSPHLQVYRPQLTSVLSILHRGTGMALYFGNLLLAVWLFWLATSPEWFNLLQYGLGTWIGQIAIFGWAFCLFYHLCNGVRHLVWDTGRGLSLKESYATGWAVVIGSVLLTGLSFYLACLMRGDTMFGF